MHFLNFSLIDSIYTGESFITNQIMPNSS